VNMASQKQIEANRRNALKSTGPLSASGKKRASRNAYRHGLSTPMDSDFARAVEDLAHCILGDTEDKHAVDLARHAAEAELELARVRRVRMALIERAAHSDASIYPRFSGQPRTRPPGLCSTS